MAQDPVIESLEIEPTHFRELNLSQEISDLASLSLIDPLNAIQSRRNAINLIENDTFDHLPSERELALRMKRNNTNNTKNDKLKYLENRLGNSIIVGDETTFDYEFIKQRLFEGIQASMSTSKNKDLEQRIKSNTYKRKQHKKNLLMYNTVFLPSKEVARQILRGIAKISV